MALPRALFAFVFGMVQGAFMFVNIPLMIVSDSLVIGLGVVVAGVMILVTPDKGSYAAVSDRMHRVALLLFGCGLVGLIIIRNSNLGSVPLLLFEMLILAGFNLVDFGGLVTSCVMRERLQTDAVTYLDSGRVLAYAGLALGLLSGYLVLNMVEAPVDHLLVVLCCVGLMILMAAVLIPAQAGKTEEACCSMAEEGRCAAVSAAARLDGVRAFAEPAEGDAAIAGEGGTAGLAGETVVSEPDPLPEAAAAADKPVVWDDLCNRMAAVYDLSARERDVFALIAKGRNAEFVQNELFISIHTAKTHIAHIYKKLEIHSQQELISLVERHQDELRR